MTSRIIILFLVALFCFSPCTAQKCPSLAKVTIRSNVSYDSLKAMYYYSYSLLNDAGNVGSILGFMVDISRDPGAVLYDTIGLEFARSDFMEWDFRDSYPHLYGAIVPVGFPSLPHGWGALWGNLTWASVSIDTDFIAPGDSVNGIIIMSRGLPTIRAGIVEPDYDVGRYLPDFDSPSNPYDLDQIDSIRQSLNYCGLTIGPWAPPSEFNAAGYTDTLKSLVSCSRSLGWITAQANADAYIRFFSRINSDLSRSDYKSAESRIDSVLERVTVDSVLTLTHEACALIRYNTEYFKQQLRRITRK